MFKNFFIVGMRRSGTSVLRKLLMKHPQIGGIEFEPHPLWNAVDLSHFRRWRDYPGVRGTIREFKDKGRGDGWHGAKFALNPGTKAMEWVWLSRMFSEAKFIFITRNQESRWQSYYKKDKDTIRGCIPKHLYLSLSEIIEKSFKNYHSENEGKCCFVKFEQLVSDADRELEKVWELIGTKPLKNLNRFMSQPRN